MGQTYEAFASEPEYLELNRRFLENVPSGSVDRILDLACGTGTCSFLLLENGASSSEIIGVDISRESLELAQLEWDRLRESCSASITFMQGDAAELPFASGTFDLAVSGNAIQLFEDKEAVVREVHRVLHAQGIFAFNTSFYAGTFVPGTERFYLLWVQEAYRYIRDRSDRSKEAVPSRGRSRGTSRAFSRPWLSREGYADLLMRNGFEIRSIAEREARLTEHSFQSIGSYTGLASVLLGGYAPDLASEALECSVGRALAMVQMTTVARNWLEVVAERR